MVFTFSIYFWRKFRRKKKFLWHILKRTKIQPGFCVVKMWEISASKCLRWRERAELRGLVPGRWAQGKGCLARAELSRKISGWFI